MPLDVVRLRDSGLTAKATGDEFRAAVLLWCASWHQVPAASLPDDDDELANLCGYGRAPKEWKKIKAGAMRGWVLCNDGRLYHPTVAAKARESWQSKLAQRARTEAARRAREEQRQRMSQALLQTPETSVTDTATESKGQGQGQGQGIKGESAARRAAAAAPSPRGSRLPSNWQPEPVHMAFAEGLGLRNGRAAAELEKFRDYWAAQPGQKGVKTDWPATWRNWVRRVVDTPARPGAAGGADPWDGAH